jgi:protein phosphatase
VKTTIIASGKTDIGRRRSSNQDQFFVAECLPALKVGENGLGIIPTSLIAGSSRSHILLVADGMGGHQGGNRAAELAVRLVVGQMTRIADWPRTTGSDQVANDEVKAILRGIVSRAHRAVVDESRSIAKFKGMGTTLTLAVTADRELWLAHVGDSRCYMIRDESIVRLTRDHTIADQIAASGGIPVSVLENSPWSNVLWNAIGADADEVVIDVEHRIMQVGDRYLLCSDGLNKHVDDTEILKLVQQSSNPHQICERLVEAAVEGGGADNVTVVAFEVVETADASSMARLHVAKYEVVFQTSLPEEEIDSISASTTYSG